MCLQTEIVLCEAIAERIRPVIFINLMDRALLQLKPGHEELYQTFQRIVEKDNVILATYCDDDGPMGVVRVDANNGSVAFGSGLHKMMQKLWGENFYNPKTKEWSKRKEEGNERSFCLYVLGPYMVLNAVMNLRKEVTTKLLIKLRTADGKALKDLLKVITGILYEC